MNAIRAALIRRGLSSVEERGIPTPYSGESPACTIDWRATARCGTVVFRERFRRQALSWCAILDDSASMRTGDGKALAAAREAAQLWREYALSGDAWLGAFHTGGRDLFETWQIRTRRLPHGCALLCVSDFFGLAEIHLNALERCARRLDCTALVACDGTPLPLGTVRAIDAEGGRTLRVAVNLAKRREYVYAARRREAAAVNFLRDCGWRAARLVPGDADRALLRAFAIA